MKMTMMRMMNRKERQKVKEKQKAWQMQMMGMGMVTRLWHHQIVHSLCASLWQHTLAFLKVWWLVHIQGRTGEYSMEMICFIFFSGVLH